ncbi:nucleotidyltransferase family protein [Pseudomonas sp. SL4(2022)]|uniref:nucleotidyltransferase family protein n=1 Tax=Pseudomonas sp. SL4(2022) TaxID=2994661 RepID=UPI00226E9D54|nr:nucleotidyltransferase family protein [Pseudomonas sp. SL4(2022)]WAC44800.1 nucleotidyltransferase family protein [Pseudomonas sp. SL4(2022)]
MKNWKDIVVSPEISLREAIRRIDASGIQMALVADADMRLRGVLSDGDVRRSILNGIDLDGPVLRAMNSYPKTGSVHTPRAEVLAMMRRFTFHHLPLIDDDGRLGGLAMLDDFMGVVERENWVVLMVGGLGSRLRPLTDACPKPMLRIGGKPILESILESFMEQGFRRFFLSVNYMAEVIKDYFGDGAKWGARIEYLHETERLGTAGALSLLPEKPVAPLVVMNGDLITKANFAAMLEFHEEHQAAATMAVREYDLQVPYGVVKVDGVRIASIEEKPIHRFFVNGGIYVLGRDVLDVIPPSTFFDMPSLFQDLASKGCKAAAYPLREYWLDIGRLEEYERAQREWS